MTKTNYLKEIQKRLPKEINLVDETSFDFNDDEFLCILSWVKFFNSHYDEFEKNQNPTILFPIISTRLRLDFGLYRFKSDCEPNKGLHNIYISENGKTLIGKIKKQSVKELIKVWKL